MRAWGGEHEARYKDEMKLLKMVTAKEHAEASAFCQLVRMYVCMYVCLLGVYVAFRCPFSRWFPCVFNRRSCE